MIMRLMVKAALAGVGAVALAGGAYAADKAVHTMKVAAPDGTVAQVQYVGDQAPRIEFVPVSRVAMPVADDPMFADFANIDRVFAAMEQQHRAMMQQMAAMEREMPVAADGRINEAALKSMPAGSVHYSFVSTTSGNGTCTQSYQMTSYGQGRQPKVEQHSSGDCTAMGQKPMPAVATPAPSPVKVIPAKAEAPAPKAVDRDTI
jgi:hypothetical protein